MRCAMVPETADLLCATNELYLTHRIRFSIITERANSKTGHNVHVESEVVKMVGECRWKPCGRTSWNVLEGCVDKHFIVTKLII